jgi:hypothetical protein
MRPRFILWLFILSVLSLSISCYEEKSDIARVKGDLEIDGDTETPNHEKDRISADKLSQLIKDNHSERMMKLDGIHAELKKLAEALKEQNENARYDQFPAVKRRYIDIISEKIRLLQEKRMNLGEDYARHVIQDGNDLLRMIRRMSSHEEISIEAKSIAYFIDAANKKLSSD